MEGDTLVIDLSRKDKYWEKRLSEACYLILDGHKKDLYLTLILPDKKMGPDHGDKHKQTLLEALSLA